MLNPDIEWEDAAQPFTAEEREERLKQAGPYTRRRGRNFTNVRKDRTGGRKSACGMWRTWR
ncbi:MAG: hypothetical protein IPL77_18040 [Flavobacteriales bacterium]|nr:hypothetical protein [Flavobacteriales bacterium]